MICGGAVKMLLLLLLTLSCAPDLAVFPRPPVIVIPVVAVTVAALTDPTLRLLLPVIVGCFPVRMVLRSTPPR